MAAEYTCEFGRIERIVDREYINGQLWKTRFEMRLFSVERARWYEVSRYFDFYGDIPREFIGQEAKYFRAKTETDHLKREIADIEIGKITPRRDGTDGIYDIVVCSETDPRIPTKIMSQFLRSVKGNVVFPYEYLNQ